MLERLIKYFSLLLMLVMFTSVFAQNNKPMINSSNLGVFISFKKDKTKLLPTELASNVLQVTNNTSKDLELTLQISPPAGWKLFGKSTRTLVIKSKDSTFIPVRICPGAELKGSTNYVINAFISTESFTIANSIWYVEVPKTSDYNISPSAKKVYFTANSDTANFNITITNDGNSDEVLDVQAIPEKGIYFIDEKGQEINLNSRPIIVRYGQDTTLYYTIKRKEIASIPADFSNNPEPDFNKYIIRLKVINERVGRGSGKNWSSSIEFYKLQDEISVKEDVLLSLPLTVILNNNDILSDNTSSSLNLFGTKKFKNGSYLNYYYQSTFVINEMNLKTFLGEYRYLGYFHKFFDIQIGEVGGGGSSVSGKGIKGSINLKDNKFGLVYVRNPKFFDPINAEGLGFTHSYRNSYFRSSSIFQHSNFVSRKITTNNGSTNFGFNLFRMHSFGFNVGYSVENHSWITDSVKILQGYGGSFSYTFKYKKLGFSTNLRYGTPYYINLRGMSGFNSNINYSLKGGNTIGFNVSTNESKPEFCVNGQLVKNEYSNKQTSFNLSFGLNSKKHEFVLNPTYYFNERNTSQAKTGGMNFSYRKRTSKDVRVFTTIFGGYTFFPLHPELNKVFVTQTKIGFGYKGANFNIRYTYGPYYSIEQTQYILTKENPQKIFSTFYYDYWFMKNTFRLSTNFNYMYTMNSKNSQFVTNPELFYYTKNGIVFSLYTRCLLYSQGETQRTSVRQGNEFTEIIPASSSIRFEFGTGIKFNVNVPLAPNRKFDVRIVAFRDLNGNGVKDPNEKGIDNMLIRLKINDTISGGNKVAVLENPFEEGEFNEFELITNLDGNVFYNDVPLGDYIITAMPLTSLGGWFDGKTFYKHIGKDEVYYIPLSKGARISGGILVEREQLTDNKKIILRDIRVTAINTTDGKTFSTLTDEEGNFVMYVPNGEYIISINDAAVGDRWNFLQNNIPLKVEEDYENYNVSFYLAEKKRTIKFNNSDPTRSNEPQKPGITLNDLRNSNPTQKTQLNDPLFLPVVEPNEEGKQWVIQLYPNEGPRLYITDFDTVKGLINVRCVLGSNAGFLYVSETFNKKRKAKKVLIEVINRGYKDAKVVQYVFGNKVNTTAKIEPNKKIDLPIDTVSKEPLKIDTSKTTNVVNNTPTKSIKSIVSEEEKNLYRVEIKVSAVKLSEADLNSLVPDENEIFEIQIDGLWKYSIGGFTTYEEAKELQKKLQKSYTLPDSFVTQYKDAW